MMVRISDISAPAELLLEERREALRDKRCERRCEAALQITKALRNLVGAAAFALTASHLAGIL